MSTIQSVVLEGTSFWAETTGLTLSLLLFPWAVLELLVQYHMLLKFLNKI